MLHQRPLCVIYVVGESALQRIVDLSILIQLVNDQLVHYVDVERGRDLQPEYSIALF